MTKLFLDGDMMDADSVSQPLLSRGFAFGFGVFETMKFLGGEPCFFAEHLRRLKRGLEGAGIGVELDESVLRDRARRLFEAEGVSDGVFKIVISDTGVATRVALFVRTVGLPEEVESSRLCMSKVVKASQAFTSRHKSLNYMESLLELEKAKAAGFDECVFENENRNLTECAVANLFFVKDGILKTGSLECGLLDGIVRQKIISLARSMGIAVAEGFYSESELAEADEAFLTSSGSGPRSVASFQARDGRESEYAIDLLPRLRAAYLELESQEAIGRHA